MAERLKKLFSLPNPQYAVGCPLIVGAGNLLLDSDTGKLIVQLKLKNISSKTVSAAKVSITAFEANGVAIEGTCEYQYLDLKISRDQEFGHKIAIRLGHGTARSYNVVVTEVVFSDGEVWKSTSTESVNLPIQEDVCTYFSCNDDLAEQYRIENGKRSMYIPVCTADLWCCSCGAINHEFEDNCHDCGLAYDAQLLNLNKDYLQQQLTARKEREEAELEAQKAALAAKRAANKKLTVRIVAIVVLICVAIVGVLAYTNVIAPKMKYNNALEALENEEYAEALPVFKELGDYKDSAIHKTQAYLGLADEAVKAGDYESAIEYYTFANTDEVKNQINNCNYHMMLDAIEVKDWDMAEEQYKLVKGYQDADDYLDLIYVGVSEGLIADGEYSGALETLEKCTNQDTEGLSQHYMSIAEGLVEAGDYEKALTALEYCAEDAEAVTALRDSCNYNLGIAAYEAENYAGAAEILTDLLKHKTYSADAIEYYYLSAKALFESGDKKTAIEYFEKISDYKDAKSYLPKKELTEKEKWSTVTLTNLQGTWKWYSSVDKSENFCDTIIINGNYAIDKTVIDGEVSWYEEAAVTITDRSASGKCPAVYVGHTIYISHVTSTYFVDAGHGRIWYKQ